MSTTIPWTGRRSDPAADIAREHVSLLRGLIALSDQLDRWEAGATGSEAVRVARLRDGLVRLLLSHGLRPTARAGSPVDVRFHEVVATRSLAPGEVADQVGEVIQSGWELMSLGERVTLRQAKVVVAVSADGSPPPPGAAADRSAPPSQPEETEKKENHDDRNAGH